MNGPGAASSTNADAAPLHQLIGIAVVLGAVGAVAALAFVALVSAGQSVLWPDSIDPGPFSGSIRVPIIMTIGGLLVGVTHATVSSAAEGTCSSPWRPGDQRQGDPWGSVGRARDVGRRVQPRSL